MARKGNLCYTIVTSLLHQLENFKSPLKVFLAAIPARNFSSKNRL